MTTGEVRVLIIFFKVFQKWLLDNKYEIHDDSAKGNVEVMNAFLDKGCMTDRVMYGAAKHGCLTIKKWLLDNGMSDWYVL